MSKYHPLGNRYIQKSGKWMSVDEILHDLRMGQIYQEALAQILNCDPDNIIKLLMEHQIDIR